MSADTPFDRTLRRLRRDRATRRFGEADYLHRLAADELLERLDWVKREFREALILGAPDDYAAGKLRERGLAVTSADPGRLFGRQADVQCDEDRLPFADNQFDLIFSVGTLDSVNDLPGALALIRRTLRPDGLFLAALTGAGSLPRLRSAMLAADSLEGAASPHIHPQIDVRAAGDLLIRAGFALPVADAHGVTVRYSGLPRLVADLRAMGATNILASRSRSPIGRLGYAAAIADFADAAEPDGKTPERFEILHLIGWAPAPNQPQPARRGSGMQSLAAALRRRG
ncbi:MAG TPA: methyltransferase domain-containing protein [Allosphingosinicella sp.]|nr:methyltransferase domain-containing protein [Allosphingosinicella sp.]